MSHITGPLSRAADYLMEADGLLICAGAGMGVDSGLPDFRGNAGFWRAYPALASARIAFEEIACPNSFRQTPTLAWGFYGHRLQLYRRTVPHAGFSLLQTIGRQLAWGSFVFTSNVDGQFQRAGFSEDIICEVHGSLHHLQSMEGCGGAIVPADDFEPDVDKALCRLRSPLPRCPACEALMRPNVLMFGDGGWLSRRTERQYQTLRHWLATLQRPVVVELGAGSHVPTVRRFSEALGAPLLRINPTEAEIPAAGVSLPLGALEALSDIEAVLSARNFLAP